MGGGVRCRKVGGNLRDLGFMLRVRARHRQRSLVRWTSAVRKRATGGTLEVGMAKGLTLLSRWQVWGQD